MNGVVQAGGLMVLLHASVWSFCSARLKNCLRVCLHNLFLHEAGS